MAEVIGLAVGFVGLAGLSTTCVDCFKLVQVYDSRACDYKILQDALDNQQFHFMVWGMACGFMDQERPNARYLLQNSTLSLLNVQGSMILCQQLAIDGLNRLWRASCHY
jgi:fibrillarin-like rRNA methylase